MGEVGTVRKIFGGGFYLAAAVYLLAAKPPDFITVFAVIACVALAGLGATKYSDWAVIGGGMLIAGSLFLQSVLFYRCLDCIRADLILLTGVITLAVMDQGKYSLALRVLSATIAAFMALTMAIHYEPAVVFGLEVHYEPGQLPGPGRVIQDRYVEVLTPDNRILTLDIAEKPVLFFSPTCGACLKAVEALAKADPEGEHWVPVQSYGDPVKGRSLLSEKGYRGGSYTYAAKWYGSVPAMVTAVRDGGVVKISSLKEMLGIVRRDAG